MKILDRYFMNRIDCKLDESQPLDPLTAWYVNRNPHLYEYYTAMLKLEIELRFSDNNFSEYKEAADSDYQFEHQSNQQNYNPACCENRRQLRKNYYQNYLPNNRFLVRAVTIIFVIFVTFSFTFFLYLQFFSKSNLFYVIEPNKPPEQNKKIDLADFFDLDELLSTASNPITDILPIQNNSIENSILEFMIEPIVNFTDHPLKTTTSFLETAGIIHSSTQKQTNKL
ncbi:MAG: hypothetical protein LBE18_07995 [Planctomycetaceae bacterium]|jgi:hypothetical protein|nr:hypothetical protein [Planctomycetaceae bacterium]